jgi:hypothetical protein
VNPAIVKMILERCGGAVSEQFVLQQLNSNQTNDIIVAYNLLLDSHPHLRVSLSAGNLQSLHSVASSDALDAIKSFATSPPMNLRDEESLIPTPPSLSSSSSLSLGEVLHSHSFNPSLFHDEDDDVDMDGEGSRSLGSRPMKLSSTSNTSGSIVRNDLVLFLCGIFIKNNNKKVIANKSNWYLGVLTEKNPEAVMMECYRVLRLCEFEWKTVTKFNILVRPMAATRRRAMSMSKKRRSVIFFFFFFFFFKQQNVF